MALQYVVYPARRDLDAVIVNQIPADPYLAEVVITSQIQDLLFNVEGSTRSLAGFIGVVGPVLKNASKEEVAKAYILYVNSQNENQYKGSFSLEIKNGSNLVEKMKSIPVHFIGVWDTVKRLGVETKSRDLTNFWNKHHDHPKLSEHITHACHALALHELRPELAPTLREDWDDKKQFLKQIWFQGAHADIGGGNSKTELSDIAPQWMVCESAMLG